MRELAKIASYLSLCTYGYMQSSFFSNSTIYIAMYIIVTYSSYLRWVQSTDSATYPFSCVQPVPETWNYFVHAAPGGINN